MVGLAVFLAVGGVVVWLYSRRKGDRYIGRLLLIGLPGLYLAGLASFGASKWLYVPGWGLLVSCYVMQVVIWRRHKASKDSVPPDPDGAV